MKTCITLETTNELARKDSGGSSNLSYFLSEQQHLMRDKRKKENLRPASLWPRLKPPQPKINNKNNKFKIINLKKK